MSSATLWSTKKTTSRSFLHQPTTCSWWKELYWALQRDTELHSDSAGMSWFTVTTRLLEEREKRRKDGSVDFYRGWNDYKRGFGNLEGKFWLDLDKIYRLTRQTKKRLRVDLKDFEGKRAFAKYDYFAVASEENKYRLSLGTYSDEYNIVRKDKDQFKFPSTASVCILNYTCREMGGSAVPDADGCPCRCEERRSTFGYFNGTWKCENNVLVRKHSENSVYDKGADTSFKVTAPGKPNIGDTHTYDYTDNLPFQIETVAKTKDQTEDLKSDFPPDPEAIYNVLEESDHEDKLSSVAKPRQFISKDNHTPGADGLNQPFYNIVDPSNDLNAYSSVHASEPHMRSSSSPDKSIDNVNTGYEDEVYDIVGPFINPITVKPTSQYSGSVGNQSGKDNSGVIGGAIGGVIILLVAVVLIVLVVAIRRKR
ncbi:Ryncolin-3 [Exaiptasia diaphana]|nr:Ryncolin-3 [Exaiptasia diaphana]